MDELSPFPASGHVAPSTRLPVLALAGDACAPYETDVAEEVPVALAYNRRPHVVMMCSPIDLEDFAVGFTASEGIASASEISHLAVARHARGVEVDVEIAAARADRLAERTRAISGRTGCGLCGVEAIEDAVRQVVPVTSPLVVEQRALWRAAAALDGAQPVNRVTRAVHAAAWATPDGTLRVVREDVGRHNALDKVLGALLRAGSDPSTGFILVTSRASFELVQKSAACGVPLLAAVSRPTGLAIRMAQAARSSLVALVRGESANVYAGAARITR